MNETKRKIKREMLRFPIDKMHELVFGCIHIFTHAQILVQMQLVPTTSALISPNPNFTLFASYHHLCQLFDGLLTVNFSP